MTQLYPGVQLLRWCKLSWDTARMCVGSCRSGRMESFRIYLSFYLTQGSVYSSEKEEHVQRGGYSRQVGEIVAIKIGLSPNLKRQRSTE